MVGRPGELDQGLYLMKRRLIKLAIWILDLMAFCLYAGLTLCGDIVERLESALDTPKETLRE